MLQNTILFIILSAYVLADPIPAPVPAPQITSFPTNFLSDLPTLPASVESYFESAASAASGDATLFTDPCSPTALPDYLSTAPAYVISALTSYEIALSSWYALHSTDLESDTSFSDLGSFPTSTYTCGAAATGTAAPKTTESIISTKTGGSTGTGTGTATKATGSASGTGTGSAAVSTSSSGAASKEGLVLSFFAGIFGVLGLVAAL